MQEQKKSFLERMEMGYEWLEQGNLPKIHRLFRTGLESGPDFMEKAFLHADFVVQTIHNYHHTASPMFYDLILEQPENPWPHLYRGLAFLMGDPPFLYYFSRSVKPV